MPLAPEPRLLRVLYIEQAPRWEYRFVRALLQREGDLGGAKIRLRVLLLDGSMDLAEQDSQVLAGFPARAELKNYDVVILGDVEAKHARFTPENQKALASWVREDGGGLLVLAGRLHGAHALKGTPLEAVLPVIPEAAKKNEGSDGFRIRWTDAGRKHQLFRLGKDEKASADLWARLPVMYGPVQGYRPREGASVLAVHPAQKIEKAEVPLVVEQTFGVGRTLFLGFDESWRWRAVDQGQHHTQFWAAAINSLVGRAKQ